MEGFLEELVLDQDLEGLGSLGNGGSRCSKGRNLCNVMCID